MAVSPSSVCPTCKRVFDPAAARSRAQAAARGTTPAVALGPFCSARCRQVDLGKWLNEEYRVPVGDESAEDGGQSSGGGEPS